MHDLDLIARHFAFAVIGMIGQARRLCTETVTTQIGDDDGESFREFRCHAMPDQMRLRIAVQQQQRWATAADQGVDFNAIGVNAFLGEGAIHADIYTAM